jgi:hypothetical protein
MAKPASDSTGLATSVLSKIADAATMNTRGTTGYPHVL